MEAQTRTQLLEAHQHLTVAIRGSEEWHPSYKKNRASFKALIEHEAELQTQTAEYLARLADRAVGYVDWSQLPNPIKAATSPVLNKDDAAWAAENIDFQQAVIDALTLLTATGGQAGEATYGIYMGLTSLDKDILEAARTQTAELVTQVTETNRNLIRESIKQSIARGEDITSAVTRLRQVINNPVRAEMIAQTESVNAYQSGLGLFASKTGAKTKTWEALAGACAICSPLDGETVDIDEAFSNGKDLPSAHPRCRCSVIYNY